MTKYNLESISTLGKLFIFSNATLHVKNTSTIAYVSRCSIWSWNSWSEWYIALSRRLVKCFSWILRFFWCMSSSKSSLNYVQRIGNHICEKNSWMGMERCCFHIENLFVLTEQRSIGNCEDHFSFSSTNEMKNKFPDFYSWLFCIRQLLRHSDWE